VNVLLADVGFEKEEFLEEQFGGLSGVIEALVGNNESKGGYPESDRLYVLDPLAIAFESGEHLHSGLFLLFCKFEGEVRQICDEGIFGLRGGLRGSLVSNVYVLQELLSGIQVVTL
jgi:hypothetical protein